MLGFFYNDYISQIPKYLPFFRLTDKILTKIVQKCRPYVLHLNVRHCWKITKQSFLSISGCRNIQDLNISDCKGLTVGYCYYLLFIFIKK
jgi:hypothetical protein